MHRGNLFQTLGCSPVRPRANPSGLGAPLFVRQPKARREPPRPLRAEVPNPRLELNGAVDTTDRLLQRRAIHVSVDRWQAPTLKSDTPHPVVAWLDGEQQLSRPAPAGDEESPEPAEAEPGTGSV